MRRVRHAVGTGLGFPEIMADSVRKHVFQRQQAAHQVDFNDGKGAVYLGQLPAPVAPTASKHVPIDAADLYIEAVQDLQAKRKAAGIISKCRSILDVCLTDRGFGTGTRRQRIVAMRDAKMLTADLADWAENLWDDGNPAVHEIKGNEDKARQHVEFLRLFFEVVYDIPAQVIASRGGSAGAP